MFTETTAEYFIRRISRVYDLAKFDHSKALDAAESIQDYANELRADLEITFMQETAINCILEGVLSGRCNLGDIETTIHNYF